MLGGIYDENGLDIPYLMESRDSFGIVSNRFPNAISNQELLEKECDILIPAAISGVINKHNVDKINCQIVIEAANGPTTKEAIKVLDERGILLVPDILANAGGVVVSYFEWCQNNQGYYWTEEEVDSRLKEIMKTSFSNVYATSKKYGVNMKIAAYIEGIKKLAEASRLRGWLKYNRYKEDSE